MGRAVKWAQLALLAGIIVLSSWQALHVGYFADDFDFLLRRSHGVSIVEAFTKNTDGTAVGGSWRPLTLLSFWISMPRGAVADHFVSITIYFCVIVLIFFIGKRLWNSWFAFGVAAVAALLPAHVEPVAWIAARADLLAAVGGLAALLCWMRGRRAWALVWYGVSLLCKEVWVLLPAAFIVYEWEHHELTTRQRVQWLGAFAAGALAWGAVRFGITQYGVGGYSVRATELGISRFAKAAVTYAAGVWNYGAFQAATARAAVLHWKVASIGVLAVAIAAWAATPKRLKFIYAAHVALALPMLLLAVPFLRVSATVQEQRYWFAPSLMLVLLGGAVIFRYLHRIAMQRVIVLLVCAVLVRGYVSNVQQFSAAAQYRDLVFSGGESYTTVALLPDTYHGVHLWASPFYEDARQLRGAPIRPIVLPLFQSCDETCYSAPALIDVTSSTAQITTATPRFVVVGEQGLRASAQTPLPVGIWDGRAWQDAAYTPAQIRTKPVEKP